MSNLHKNTIEVMVSGLVLAKILYFSTGLASVGWNRFQNLYFLGKGLAPGQIGELKTIGLALKFIGEPFWCFIADMTDPKLVFILSLFASIGSLEILRNTADVTYWTVILVKLVRTATAPQATLTIMASMELIKGSQEGYGQQRLYGSLAWGIGAYVVGILIDTYGTNSMFYFTYFFQILSLAIVLRYLPARASGALSKQDVKNSNDTLQEEETASTSKVSNVGAGKLSSTGSTGTVGMMDVISTGMSKLSLYIQELRQFFRNRCCRVILLNALIYGVVMQTCDTYLYLAVEQDYNGSKAYSGLCVMATTLSCIPIFYYSKRVIQLYGHSNMIMVSHVTLVLRLFLLSLIRPGHSFSLYGILLVQLMHGFNYALFWSASVDAVFHQSPKHLGTSCMATLNLFYQALGFGIGSLLWGYVYEFLGGMNSTFYLLAILASLAATAYFYYQKQDIDIAMMEKGGSDEETLSQTEALLGGKNGQGYSDKGEGLREFENMGTSQRQDIEGGKSRAMKSAAGKGSSDVGSIYTSPTKGLSSEGVISQQRKHSRDYDFRV